jgi:hypothetical protein
VDTGKVPETTTKGSECDNTYDAMQASQTAAGAMRGNATNWRALAWWLAAFAITATVLVLRRPDAVLSPQFYADDGQIWFQQAYNDGAISLLYTYAGYFQTLSRLGAVIALYVPLSQAPLVMNLVALLVEASPPLFLLSPRMRNVGTLALRCVLALLYFTVPNVAELHANITNAQFNLAMLGYLIVIAEAPQSRAARIFDLAALVTMVLTGPFCILLLPVALLVKVVRRQAWKTVLLSVIAGGAAVQGLALLLTGHERTHQKLGASFVGFCHIIAGQIVLPVLQGRNRLHQLAHSPATATVLACVITTLTGILFFYALWRGSLELRSFILFALLLLAASLAFPTPNASTDHWGPMQMPGGAGRYWYFPEMALMATFVWLLGGDRPAALRAAAVVLLCFMTFGVARHWRYASLPDLHFAGFAQQFEQLPPGTSLEIPINPPGWSMTLVKK